MLGKCTAENSIAKAKDQLLVVQTYLIYIHRAEEGGMHAQSFMTSNPYPSPHPQREIGESIAVRGEHKPSV